MNYGPVLQTYGDVVRGRTPLACLRVALMTSFLGGFALAAQAQTGTCTVTSIGRTPLNDLGPNLYNGYGGGLYPGGSNVRPPAHESAGLTAASAVRPLNASGQVDDLAGRIGLVSIGNSTVYQEFEVFGYLSNIDPRRHPKLVSVTGAQDGQSAADWADPNSPAWTGLAQAVAQRGLTSAQVQVAWIKVAIRSDDVGGWQNVSPFPATAEFLRSALRDVTRNLKQKYPNVQIAYLSSRIFAGYAGLSGYPEPIAYDEGFSVKWVIEDQLSGDPTLRYAGPNAPAPFLAWGPYLWADGEGSDGISGGVPGRSDGLEYSCADFSDGLHLSPSGSHKVADQLLEFFHTDTTSAFWYINPSPPPPPASPFYVQFDGVDDYADVAGTSSLVLANGLVDSPFTFEMWVRPTTMAGKQNLLGKWWSGLDQQYRFSIVSNTLRLDLRDGSAAATVSAITATTQASLAGGWHHVAATYDGRGGPTAANGITLYVDGVAVPLIRMNHAAYVAMEHRAIPIQIGRESPGFRQYSGGLDDFRIWTVARTSAQIQGSRATELTGTEAGLVAYWRFNEGIGALVADDSPSTNTAILYNNPTAAAGGPMAAPTPDVTPPGIENIVESNLADTSIRIAFHTTEVATGWVSLTTNQSCPCTDVYSQGAGTEHVVTLTGLDPRRAYIYEIKALDAYGNFGVSSRRGFTTLAPVPDVMAPAVAITRPSMGSVAGTVLVEVQATDNVGVSGVRLTLDGVSLGSEDTVAPYSMSWTTTQVADGPHTLTAEARDAAGNVGTVSVLVNVSNAAGTIPYYLQFDGIDDYAEVADSSSLVLGNGLTDSPFTFEMWIRPNTMTGKQNLLSKWLYGPNQQLRLHINSNTVRLDFRDGSAAATVSVYTTNSQSALAGGWHHLAVTYDGRGGATAATGVTIYVDGLPVAVTRINHPAYVAMEHLTMPMVIGRESSAFRQYGGGLDEFRIWRVARTQSQLQLGMAVELSGTDAGLAAYWRFNEAIGSTVADTSPGGNQANLRNGPIWTLGGPLAP